MPQDNHENRVNDRGVRPPDGAPAATRPGPDGAPPLPAENHDRPKSHRLRWILLGVAVVVVLVLGLTYGRRWLVDYFTTVSTDDAYVNSHVSYISPRVAGYVTAVYADDTQRVEGGALLLELDHEPYEVAVAQKRAALEVAEANLTAAQAQVRAQEAAARDSWFSLVNAQEQVRYQIATLKSNVANLRLQETNLELARKEVARTRRLVQAQAGTEEELEQRGAAVQVAEQQVAQARETIRRTRAALGLPPDDRNPTEVPADLEQNFSSVQVALSQAAQSLAQIGVPLQLYRLTPDKLHQQLLSHDPSGDLNRALDRFVEKAPAVLQARAARDQAREDLRNAELNLRYTYVYAPIDGQVMRRSVNPGDNVAVGQSLMAVRSMTDVWIDANFKETKLDYLRIGQPVNIRVDAYPHKVFHGRVEGFSAGTGASLALIPPENATGNFVKIVQRLPVRVTINPEDLSGDTPLFVGLSTQPQVLYREQPTGPNAGQRLVAPLPPSGPGRGVLPPPAAGGGGTRAAGTPAGRTGGSDR